ncbi:acyl-CoA/acyl-ACP dehydrogenase [Nocardioides sp. zg-ZUI104]|uniref:acyl-CoA dehydrogenase family protein n=1 Tax=Nocardioides faecalis TaxID=2803858 RepID=UPI001BD05D1E|nr:acyl-CoA dehydrogenase family protein [Nocardioides faecalis]MBS4752156.1 acyl-CoA/acyl-ACP dehydrogenase [Nocardioides faecalis]
MHATFTRDQQDIAATVRAMVGDEKTGARAALDEGWSAPSCDAALLEGFSGLGVAESAGGPGSSLVDLLVAVEALGASLVPSRFAAHAAAIQLLAASGEVPEAALEGQQVLTGAVVVPGEAGWAPTAGGTTTRTLVAHAESADAFVVAGTDGVRLLDRASVEVRQRESFDPAVPLADVTPTADGELAGAGEAGLQRATLVAAAELSGVAQGAIDLAAEYARNRHQFGRPIGSFQAVAFQLAEAVAVRKAAWDLSLYAAWAVDNARPDAAIQVHAAKAAAGKAAVFAAERCIQVHGGMGITREADPHLFLRRAFVLDASYGTGAWHRRRTGALRVADRRASA